MVRQLEHPIVRPPEMSSAISPSEHLLEEVSWECEQDSRMRRAESSKQEHGCFLTLKKEALTSTGTDLFQDQIPRADNLENCCFPWLLAPTCFPPGPDPEQATNSQEGKGSKAPRLFVRSGAGWAGSNCLPTAWSCKQQPREQQPELAHLNRTQHCSCRAEWVSFSLPIPRLPGINNHQINSSPLTSWPKPCSGFFLSSEQPQPCST